MDEEKELNTIMECPSSYLLKDENGDKIEDGDAKVLLNEENFSLYTKFKDALLIPFRDIMSISSEQYKIQINLYSSEQLIIFNLGYRFEDFLRVFLKLRNALLLKDMLMDETLRKSGTEAEYVHINKSTKIRENGQCQPKLYDSALIMISDSKEPLRIPYGDIIEIKAENNTLNILTEYDDQFIFSKMGRQYSSFVKTFTEVMNEISLETQTSLKKLLPKASPLIIRKVSKFMKDGKAAKRTDLEAISSTIWSELEEKIKRTEIKDEYELFKSIAKKDKMCIGLKQGLMGDLTGEYIWFLIPIYSNDSTIPGNAIAMESISSDGGGKATYFFRIISRNDYAKVKDLSYLHQKTDDYLTQVNRCMLAINFRREPIYLAEEKLEEPEYQKYKTAMINIPELKILRESFIGRIVHSSFEQWKTDVIDLLTFNVTATSDKDKWEKSRKKDSL